ncbi:MAG: NAD(P)/FAD-dependent oxidoreductase [Patescibacteria group bacterium]|nr:NAD(P)/FAD-dependent oxidoreductase [Patescibacteria group bacterium]
MLRPHIVIMGAGFGGTYTAKKLARMVRRGKADLTIVNKTNYFLFTPLLHEVATGSLSPRSVAEPLREIFRGTNVRIVQGDVVSIDRSARTVKVNGGPTGEKCELKYDYLVIAAGAETNYYGIPGAKEYAMPLKSLADAVMVRSRIIDSFERAVIEQDEAKRRTLLSFAVVGGGPTGVETAAELAEFARQMAERYYGRAHCRPENPRRCEPEEASVSIIHMGKELLEQFSHPLRQAAENRLRKDGVTLELGTAVTAVSPAGLSVQGPEGTGARTIPAATVIWAAGVKPIVPRFTDGEPPLPTGRLPVDESFRLITKNRDQRSGDELAVDERIFALGDVAAYIDRIDAGSDSAKPKPLPQLAQVAKMESSVVARNIKASITGKKLIRLAYRSKGSMVSVGQWFAVGEIYSINIAGRLAWWLWRTVYLMKFASWRKRIRIAFEWAYELISPRDITKVI